MEVSSRLDTATILKAPPAVYSWAPIRAGSLKIFPPFVQALLHGVPKQHMMSSGLFSPRIKVCPRNSILDCSKRHHEGVCRIHARTTRPRPAPLIVLSLVFDDQISKTLRAQTHTKFQSFETVVSNVWRVNIFVSPTTRKHFLVQILESCIPELNSIFPPVLFSLRQYNIIIS